jgi:hypothetical protein
MANAGARANKARVARHSAPRSFRPGFRIIWLSRVGLGDQSMADLIADSIVCVFISLSIVLTDK